MGVFISHSSEDKGIVSALVELLEHGVGFAPSDLFCTSIDGTIRTGEDFLEAIRARLETATLLIPLVSRAYLASRFCGFEIGAAWARHIPLLPVLVPQVMPDDVDPIIRSKQAAVLDRPGDLDAFRDAVKCFLPICSPTVAPGVWEARRTAFLNSVPLLADDSEYWIYALIGKRQGREQRVVGLFRLERLPRTPGAVIAKGEAYWVDLGGPLTPRGHWISRPTVIQGDEMILYYSMRNAGGIEVRELPEDHEGLIVLTREAALPIRGDRYYAGRIHDLFEWRDNTPAIFAERLPKASASWDKAKSLVTTEGAAVFREFVQRAGIDAAL